MALLDNIKKAKSKHHNQWRDKVTPDVVEREIKGVVLAIDPGTTESAFSLYDSDKHKLIEFGKINNEELLERLEIFRYKTEHLAIEGLACYGSTVGASTFKTAYWIGRYWQRWLDVKGDVKIIQRRAVKAWITPGIKSNDSVIRKALIKMFPATGKDSKGKPSSIGTKKNPGPLYGVTKDVWSSTAIALTFCRK